MFIYVFMHRYVYKYIHICTQINIYIMSVHFTLYPPAFVILLSGPVVCQFNKCQTECLFPLCLSCG